jgi:hypothetical protein
MTTKLVLLLGSSVGIIQKLYFFPRPSHFLLLLVFIEQSFSSLLTYRYFLLRAIVAPYECGYLLFVVVFFKGGEYGVAPKTGPIGKSVCD